MDELTPDEIIVADLIISKLLKNEGRNLHGMIHSLADNRSDLQSNSNIQFILSESRSYRSIIEKLLDKDFLTVKDGVQYYALTDKGVKAKELGGINNYLDWERKETDILKFENFPRKKWLLFELMKGVFLIILGAFINQTICNKSTDKNVKPTTLTVDTIYLPQPSQSLPKSSDKKDSLP
jgi:predicted transcriptional regulator